MALGKINLFMLNKFTSKTDGIISVTQDILVRNNIDTNLKALQYPNGINLELFKVSNKEIKKLN